MKIIILNGSPTVGGNTDNQVKAFASGAESSGHSVEIIRVCDLSVSPCIGCNGCKTHGSCIKNDDMAKIYDAVKSSDAIVFASPVYWWSITAQLKTVLDRLYALPSSEFNGKKSALLLNGYDEDPFLPAKKQFEIIFDYLHLENKGFVCIGDMTKKDAMKDSPRLKEIYEFGVNF